MLGYSRNYLVVGGLEVVGGALHDLDGDVGVVLEVLGEPDGGEVSPAQLLDEHVPVDEDLSDEARVIAA